MISRHICHFYLGNAIVIEGEKNWTNNDDPTVEETHHQKEQIIIENPDDPASTVTHRLEDVHITVQNETSTSGIEEIAHLYLFKFV